MRIAILTLLLFLPGCAGAGFLAQGALRGMQPQATPAPTYYAAAPQPQRLSCTSFTDPTGFTMTNCNP